MKIENICHEIFVLHFEIDVDKDGILYTLKEFSNTNFNTEYTFLKELKKMQVLIETIYVPIYYEVQEGYSIDNSIRLYKIEYSVGLKPLNFALTSLFNKTKFLFNLLKYLNYLSAQDPDDICNIIQSKFWKEKLHNFENDANYGEILFLPLLIHIF